jgi:multiple sugar transport system permease protein
MTSMPQAAAARPLAFSGGSGPPPGLRQLRGTELKWAIAFVAPYAAVFLAFVVYPVGYALAMASRPELYADLFSDPLFVPTFVNTVFFVAFAVNLKMFLALLLSGFFMRRRWWIKALLGVYVVPWAIAAAQACVSLHWMLIGAPGLINGVLAALFGLDGPNWLDNRWLALTCDVVAYTWKWMPFWTLIFLAARATIPRDIYDAAEVDGATGIRRFVHVTFPLMANIYLICSLVSALWALGDFTTVYLVSSGAPGGSSDVLATLGYHYAFDVGNPALGVAAVMSALPLLIPIMIVLMRRVHLTAEARL